MTRCILHYGMPKTGSSAIQAWLFRKLDDPAFVYLNLGQLGSGNLIVQAFATGEVPHRNASKRAIHAAQLAAEASAVKARLLEQLAGAGERTVLFSAERLANSEPGTIHAIHAFFAEKCEQLEAAGYIRAPVQFMESVYQQRLRSGAPQFNPDRLYPGYRRRLGVLEQQIGAARMSYWKYEPASFPQGCVVRDFCAHLGIHSGEAEIRRANDSLSLDAIRLLYAYRRFGPGYGSGGRAMRENRDLINWLRKLEGPKLRIDALTARAVLEANRDDIAWAEERLGTPFAERLGEGDECIREEADLLRFSAASLEWLGAQSGAAKLARDPSPQRVADAVQKLRERTPSASRSLWRKLRRRIGLG